MSCLRRAASVLLVACAAWSCEREPPGPDESDRAPGAGAGTAARKPEPPLDPVPERRLVELLGKELAGWQLESVTGDRHPLGRAEITSALGVYKRTQGDATQTLSIGIIDGARAPQAYTSFEIAWTTRLENASLGYSRFQLGPDRGVQILSRHPLTVQIHLLVANRFLIQADSEKVEPEVVRAFVEALPLEPLRAWK